MYSFPGEVLLCMEQRRERGLPALREDRMSSFPGCSLSGRPSAEATLIRLVPPENAPMRHAAIIPGRTSYFESCRAAGGICSTVIFSCMRSSMVWGIPPTP